MRRPSPPFPLLPLILTLLLTNPVAGQLHRATQLGNPATRFAPPLATPADLRALFRDPQLERDIASILSQWDWKGNLADLHQAAVDADIAQIQIPVGARIPFMSSRRNGQPVALHDVLWAGNEPISAYAFDFSSRGRRYRCIAPRPCANFYLVDLGPEPPRLQLIKTAPTEASLCQPIEMALTVRNTGGITLTNIQITDSLPPGLHTPDGQTTVGFEVESLPAGTERLFRYQALAEARGDFVNIAHATAVGGVRAEAKATTTVRAPALALECDAPAARQDGRTVELCLTLRNEGDAPDPLATLELRLPQGVRLVSTTHGGSAAQGRVDWSFPDLGPNDTQRVCMVLATRHAGPLALTATAVGRCGPPVQAECVVQVTGIPAVLLEVVDLADPIPRDQEVLYDITVTNQGSATLHNVQLLFNLPASQQWVSCTGSTPARVDQRTATTDILTALEPKAVASWRVIVKAVEADDARFEVALRSDEFERPIVEVEATQQR
jgi:uncharacterized repeat protein (TIGR01451 family)